MSDYSLDLRDLLEAGCHFGHQARRWNPKMTEYIYTDRDGVHIFDLATTAEHLVRAMEFVRDWVAQGNDIVFVGTKRQAAPIVREEAVKVGAPFVHVRWLGGTLTNWEEMHKRIKKLKGMKEKRENGEYDSYTKKEQVLIDREIARLDRFFGGIANYEAMPSALFVVDTHREETAIKEAKMVGIPVVGMVDTNADPDLIDYVIPVNDDAVRSIKLVVSHIAQAYAEGKALAQKGGKTKIDAKVQQQEARAEEKPKEVSKAVKKVKNLEKKEKPVSMEKNKKPKVVRKAASPSKKAEKKTNTKSAGSKGGKRKKKVSAKKK